MTTAYVFEPPDDDEVTVTAGDDSSARARHTIDSLDSMEFFENHYHIINEMIF